MSKYCGLVFYVSFVGLLSWASYSLLKNGCTSSAKSCPDYTPTSMVVVSSETKSEGCACGDDCWTTCYYASFDMKYQGTNETYCTVRMDDEIWKSGAYEDREDHPP